MSKAIFKVIDEKGRIVIPAPIRAALGLSPGDIVGVKVDRGRVAVKKAIVLEDGRMPLDAKQTRCRCACQGQAAGSTAALPPSHPSSFGCSLCEPPEPARRAYAETVMRELPPDKLTDMLELAVGLLQQGKSSK